MDDKKPDPKTIAEEAVGVRRGNPTPDAAKPEMPTEEAIRQLATAAGSQADIAAQTAEAVGERVGEAYATTEEVKVGSRKAARTAASQTSRALQQPFISVAAGFALGYAAALLIHRRQ
jgi:ElaB/YqjD/DUF883 family membrane-anchored ribosome-binding protein